MSGWTPILSRQYPIRGPVPLIVNEDAARQFVARDSILNDTTSAPTPPSVTTATVVFVAT
jgi:hypothetical protein